jgi:hypothetical protein
VCGAAVLLAAWLAGAGCAGSAVNAQWSDPQFGGQPPRGARVLVACRAPDATLSRVCADRMAAKLAALGAVPVLAADGGDALPGDAALLQAAREAGAAAVLSATISPDSTQVSAAPSIGFGIGGFGGGYRSGGGVGIGLSAPVGAGAPPSTGYAASAGLSDVASGRLMWSGRASAAPSSDVAAQLNALATLLLDAARQSGLFPA